MDRKRAIEGKAAPAIDLHPSYAPGSLSWTPHALTATPEDRIVTSAFRALVAGVIPAGRARELGRDMGRQARGSQLADHLDAFSHLGIGRIRLTRLDEDRYLFDAEALEGAERAGAPSCALALGFVEGAVESATGRAALGAEMRCRSHGHATCSFVVMAR